MQALYDTLKQRDGKPQRPGIVYNPIRFGWPATVISKYEALRIAKACAKQYRLNWNEKNLAVTKGRLDETLCFIVSTLDDGMAETGSWMDFVFSTPVRFYINALNGTFLGYEAGNRGVNRVRPASS
ncbi:hypothetical protein PU707_002850 [Cronobacter sakazakii]|uniref:hypothetical protein n=1 Tax=Cronobacter sakazakii TaxID=28141 RepID=UPI001AE2D1F7|nr:hypothetical protein [Cronobacter sakazakii]EKK3980567.1 hypothetical protein [Cronobacter sakazakii]EKK3982629.1 hypothetical protein [Cronobacter sakazakii]EKM6345163.1 hypothetical protein [Cronobacter sakazakii]EKM6353066.1 hypothetical protein [Cronobacter sakazakii]EKM6354605.1 hypothetical protein [Cronobacter sakazakii]